jgi:hypothetical protein
MRSSRLLVASVLSLGVLAAPAAATHGGNHPTFPQERVYFHCSGETKIYNVNWLAQAGAETSFVPWNTTPPPGSVTTGAGCGGADVGWVTNEVYDVVFMGTFTGNLRDMTVQLDEFIVNQMREDVTGVVLRVYGEIDGEPIFPGGTPETGYTGRTLTVTPTRVNSGATDRYVFSITNLGYAIDIFDEEGNLIDVETGGMALEDGNGVNEHYLRLLVGIDSFPGEDPPTGTTAWVWDTTEVPSGLTFNPPTLAAASVAADLPDFQ